MERKIILYISMSVDGFIARKDGSVDFLDPYNESGEDYGYREFYDSIGTIVMGSTTYEQFGSTKEFKDVYKGKPIFVFSRRRNYKNFENITFVSTGAKDFINELDPKDDKDIWLVGGASILDEFLRQDRIDEFIITIIPVLLGDGIPLFKGDRPEGKLTLAGVKEFEMGVIQLYYNRKIEN